MTRKKGKNYIRLVDINWMPPQKECPRHFFFGPKWMQANAKIATSSEKCAIIE
jgi:hypothetical protein